MKCPLCKDTFFERVLDDGRTKLYHLVFSPNECYKTMYLGVDGAIEEDKTHIHTNKINISIRSEEDLFNALKKYQGRL